MKVNSIPNRLLAFTSKPTIAAVILRSSMQSNMPNFIFSIIIHHYIEWLNYSPSALRDLILAKKPFHARSTFITHKCRLDLRLKTKRVEVDWRTDSTEDGCFGERGRIRIRTREKVQTLASERESGWFPAPAQRHLSLPPRFTSFLFSSLKHHFADGCIACIIMGSKESLPQNAASEEDRAKCNITWTDLFNFTPPRSCPAPMMLFCLVTSA